MANRTGAYGLKGSKGKSKKGDKEIKIKYPATPSIYTGLLKNSDKKKKAIKKAGGK